MLNRFAAAVPELPVVSVGETQQFYCDVFGFSIEPTHGQDGCSAVSRDATVLRFIRTAQPIHPLSVLLPVHDADAVFASWRERGARIVSDVEDKLWGTREFIAEDNNGHRLRVAARWRTRLSGVRPPIENVRVVRRLPTTAEYQAIATAVGWANFANFEAAARSLSRSLFSVVAELDGRCIGTARVGGDGAVFFYIMDVGVLPEFQGRGIGTRLMNHIIDFIAAARPAKALVGLFAPMEWTNFYERFGFTGGESGICGMIAQDLRRA